MTNTVKSLFNVKPVLFALALPLMAAAPVQAEEPSNDRPEVRFETSHGDFSLELRPDVAPKTVENFLGYVDKGFYNGTIFHRVIADFMIQGGGFTEDMSRKSTEEAIVNEASAELPNERGTIAMARTSAPDSATSQFFINVVDNPYLNPGANGAGYAVFGKVTEGMDVVDAIAGVKTARVRGMADVPARSVIIEQVTRAAAED
ncbi:peptidylprolyl isomerase [Marinobacter vinifirmus]|uniref:Peptidyl-prolyl cis-trans isomerase n=1 Tax=Marinobacter vinifirmus TaxID=355591 RepID=A0A558BES2_9GAMM|nr:peptidylprolyl isomerase [Marinobacter vinifirmus]TVT34998.1 MAG: peptidyl-prolyl cis-trans isomerase [Marinobacter vinifirmus]